MSRGAGGAGTGGGRRVAVAACAVVAERHGESTVWVSDGRKDEA